jgi:hypothetical protein
LKPYFIGALLREPRRFGSGFGPDRSIAEDHPNGEEPDDAYEGGEPESSETY